MRLSAGGRLAGDHRLDCALLGITGIILDIIAKTTVKIHRGSQQIRLHETEQLFTHPPPSCDVWAATYGILHEQ